MYHKNKYCSFCGNLFPQALSFPHQCSHCANTTYVNPLPVAVALVPLNGGLLTVRRNIAPKKGELALPGGFIEVGETWQAAVVRELWEETGIKIDGQQLKLFDTLSAPDGTLLVFGLIEKPEVMQLPAIEHNTETQELVIITAYQPLCFPLHTKVCKDYFDKLNALPY
jgi:ADP-ribose pyrophosphatase YjhB (NUDIX family)